jgi:hypothetical protein
MQTRGHDGGMEADVCAGDVSATQRPLAAPVVLWVVVREVLLELRHQIDAVVHRIAEPDGIRAAVARLVVHPETVQRNLARVEADVGERNHSACAELEAEPAHVFPECRRRQCERQKDTDEPSTYHRASSSSARTAKRSK